MNSSLNVSFIFSIGFVGFKNHVLKLVRRFALSKIICTQNYLILCLTFNIDKDPRSTSKL